MTVEETQWLYKLHPFLNLFMITGITCCYCHVMIMQILECVTANLTLVYAIIVYSILKKKSRSSSAVVRTASVVKQSVHVVIDTIGYIHGIGNHTTLLILILPLPANCAAKSGYNGSNTNCSC